MTDAMTTTVLPRPAPVPIAAPADDRRARLDAAVRLGAGVGLWLSLRLVAWWWAAGGGVRGLGGWPAGLTSLGRLTGLVASDLLLVQVLLMARVPPLERAFGQDHLVRRHRLVGFASFNLLVAHIVLITWGYAAGELARTPATLWDPVTGYPGMLLALPHQLWTGQEFLASPAHGRHAARWLRARPGRSGLVVWADGSTTLVGQV